MPSSKSGLSFLVLAASCAFAQPLIQDDFNRQGSLAGSNPNIGTTWTGDALPVDNAVHLGAQESEAATRFTSVKGATLYAGFDFTVNTISALSSFPFSFLDDTITPRSTSIGRVFVSSRDANQSFVVGIENNLDNPIYWPDRYTVGTTLRVVVGLTEDALMDQARLWINPVSIDSPSVADITQSFITQINGVIIRSTNSGFPSAALLDNLYVGRDFNAAAIPEPNVLGAVFSGIALSIVLLQRRRLRIRNQQT